MSTAPNMPPTEAELLKWEDDIDKCCGQVPLEDCHCDRVMRLIAAYRDANGMLRRARNRIPIWDRDKGLWGEIGRYLKPKTHRWYGRFIDGSRQEWGCYDCPVKQPYRDGRPPIEDTPCLPNTSKEATS